MEEPVVDAINYVYDDSDNSEEIIYEDGGANLVIKKSLLTPKGDSNEDYRHISFFRSICTVKDKVCNLIIGYNGSCKNMVSTEIVNKL
jgi:hypothetical protein